jgi:type II restriction enzyme
MLRKITALMQLVWVPVTCAAGWAANQARITWVMQQGYGWKQVEQYQMHSWEGIGQMATSMQKTGQFGEQRVVNDCPCPRCKRSQTLVQLPKNFRCADLICDFCGFLAQVKAACVTDITKIPSELPGGAWGPQRARMAAGIYFPLYICLIGDKAYSIFYLSADAQQKKLFRPRTPLSASARRAGWRGFRYKLATVRNHFVRLQ